MLRFRSAPTPARTGYLRNDQPATGAPVLLVPSKAPSIRRTLSRESGHALEMLGHAIEYLADEYAADVEHTGPLGNADPRVEAIQILKQLNRSVYFSGTELEPPFRRMRRWLTGAAGIDARTR
jgi:hypothetical protein